MCPLVEDSAGPRVAGLTRPLVQSGFCEDDKERPGRQGDAHYDVDRGNHGSFATAI